MEIVLGSMTFGGQTNSQSSFIMLDKFFKNNQHVDTAYAYVDDNTKIAAEEVLGEYFANHPNAKYYLATKVNPFPNSGETLTPQSIKNQFGTSLKRLRLNQVDLLYLHAPDYYTPIEETLRTVNELHKEGKFKELGLSNYSAWQVTDIYHICKENGWVLPTVYQGMYNAITRVLEDELFPALRKFGIRFMAFNPIAGGLLSGKYKYEEKPTEGRFKERPMYMDRYWKKSIFEGIDEVKTVCDKFSISLADASFRWLSCHSLMDGKKGDGIIFGASSEHHFDANMKACENHEPLPKEIVEAFDKAWHICRADAPLYFRKPVPKTNE